jgi:hypothetical protein
MMFPWELEVTTPALTPELTASKPTPGDCLTRELGTSGTEHGTGIKTCETADRTFYSPPLRYRPGGRKHLDEH